MPNPLLQTNANQLKEIYNAMKSGNPMQIFNNIAAINANTTAQTQKILDALAQNKIDALQSRVNQLELQNAVAGVVKYPTAMTYAYNANPFCACNGGCGCNNI